MVRPHPQRSPQRSRQGQERPRRRLLRRWRARLSSPQPVEKPAMFLEFVVYSGGTDSQVPNKLAMRSTTCFRRGRNRGFTLVEIMIVVCIMAILLEIAIPGFAQARQHSRAQACVGDLTRIDNAKAEYSMQQGLITGSACT